MTRFLIAVLAGMALVQGAIAAADEGELQQTSDVIDILRANYVDREKLDGKLLNDATVAGILQALGPGASIVTPDKSGTNAAPAAAAAPRQPLARVEVIDPNIGYIRLSDVTDTAVSALDVELKKFDDASVNGYVLDLRFADGTDYDAAAALACRFVGDDRHLFGIKGGAAEPKVFNSGPCASGLGAIAKSLLDAPLLVLINGETRGGAEALAGALHVHNRAILVGSKTAGAPASLRDVPLGDGRILRLATSKLVLPADETKEAMTVDVFPQGIAPDITVKIDPQVERGAVLNTQSNVTLTASLQPKELKKHIGEAELVRAFRGESLDLKLPGSSTNTTQKFFDSETPTAEPDAVEPSDTKTNKTDKTEAKPDAEDKDEGELRQVRDVVLQHAVDVLKGIRVLLSWR